MEVTGILKVKFDTQKVSEKFQKREFVLSTDTNTPYPQHVSFQVTQDKCSLLDTFNPGEEIRVQFNLRGREWNGPQGIKYFNTLEAWRIEKLSGSQSSSNVSPASNNTMQENTSAPVFNSSIGDNDDLPF
ncbi:MAG: DUF3127 domain-containing protein [Bacteroidetes bacterium]|nr:DUF3127 domain-containing protein [Bacteroidota bacterium]